MSGYQDSKRLMKRQSSQSIWNATSGDQNHSQSKERVENHHSDGPSRNNTEQHPSESEPIHHKNQTDTSNTEHSQSSEATKSNTTDVDHSKEQTGASTASNHTVKESAPSGATLSLNTSVTPDVLASASSQAFNTSKNLSNHTAENPYSPSSAFPLSVQTSPTQLSSPTNSTSPVNLQSPEAAEQSQDTHHSKGKAWGITLGVLAAVVMIAAAIFLMKKRLKGSTDFVRRRLRSRSNDSNRAVRDRSSLEPQFGGSDPFACSSTFSKKPLVLRPDSLSQLRTGNPRRPSILHLRNQSIKSQISPPIIEPPSPAAYKPLSGGSPRKSSSGIASSDHIRSSSPSWYQNRGYPPIVSKYHAGMSQTRDPYSRSGSVLSVKNPDFAVGRYEDQINSSINSTPVPPRPPRPEWPILPFDSTGIKSFSQPVEESEPALPEILPLNVSRRLGHHRSTYTSPREQSIDQMILESPESCHDSPTLPQYRPEEDKSVFSIDREADAVRASHLSRSTCYSQSSEAEVYPIAGENVDSGLQTPTSLRFVSFGPSSNATQLERQLDYFTTHQNRSDRTFSS
ncbi:hypothetical protein PtA15_7A115 [Puccinia triticina]|uniref:Uncharacterized protein n=1 Tax=Puccinia triticina TaxID=208348 RepID=A0ABY7CMJ2_9BASI|nr:uncharacterized protein PtA15_7A115 [Puccinia triticina]WAQ86389.1 hypothetical protein PtA15_7A115 [Puccinia triticina]